jgi:hypothetical protein
LEEGTASGIPREGARVGVALQNSHIEAGANLRRPFHDETY